MEFLSCGFPYTISNNPHYLGYRHYFLPGQNALPQPLSVQAQYSIVAESPTSGLKLLEFISRQSQLLSV